MGREATIAKAVCLTREAAKLIVFPEAFVPAYPRGLSFGVVVGSRNDAGRRTWARYLANAGWHHQVQFIHHAAYPSWPSHAG